MAEKHTPKLPFRVSGGAGRLRTIDDADGVLVCEVIGKNETGAELTVRAHVHAAAPAMLAALEAVAENWSYTHGYGTNCRFCDQYDGHEPDCEILRARAAIAQAKGE